MLLDSSGSSIDCLALGIKLHAEIERAANAISTPKIVLFFYISKTPHYHYSHYE